MKRITAKEILDARARGLKDATFVSDDCIKLKNGYTYKAPLGNYGRWVAVSPEGGLSAGFPWIERDVRKILKEWKTNNRTLLE